MSSLQQRIEAQRATIQARLVLRTQFCPITGCWRWDGAMTGNGYGHMKFLGRNYMTHRMAWLILVGPICPCFILDHRCRERSCWNPAHLRPMTGDVNTHIGNAILYGMVA